jgi:hypothetical protein
VADDVAHQDVEYVVADGMFSRNLGIELTNQERRKQEKQFKFGSQKSRNGKGVERSNRESELFPLFSSCIPIFLIQTPF